MVAFRSTGRSGRRALVLAVAAALSVAAALAIAILLFGDFGGTEGRVLLTTVLLAAHGALAVPAAILWDQRRLARLAASCASLALLSAALNVGGVWWNGAGETFGRLTGTAMFVLVATVVTAALATRPRHLLFFPSVAAAYACAALASVAIWSEPESERFLRVLGSLVVLTVLLVALQPLLLRARRDERALPLSLVDETGRRIDVVVRAESFADAAARAIRSAEHEGAHVRSVELTGER